MATARDVLATKGSHVLSVSPGASVLDAALLMNEHKVGSVVVLDAGRLVGILTERDLLQRVLARRLDPSATSVAEVMTSELLCCRPHTTLDEARGVMKNRRIRHLPVVDEDGRLGGLISIGDLNAFCAHDLEVTTYFLHEYISGRV
jgi:CBS domain-containing protein